MDINNFIFNLHNFIIAIFYKEAVFVFIVFCSMFFALAAMVATWAFRNGQFSDLESSKFEMLKD